MTTFALRVAGGALLDVGSGPGRDGLLLTAQGLTVTCLDASHAMVTPRKERGLTAVEGDLLALPFPDNSFQGVWAYTSLLHVSKQTVGTALEEIHRGLVPGGVFGLGMIEGEGECYQESSGVDMPRLFAYCGQEELEQLLLAHLFHIEYFEDFQSRSKQYLNYVCIP